MNNDVGFDWEDNEMVRTVLITDDSTMQRMSIKKALPADWADTILEAKNGHEALDRMRANAVDVLFLDLTMPEMDGFEVLAALDQPDSGISKPMIFVLSADFQPESIKICEEHGVCEFVRKPISADALLAVLQRQGLHS